MSQEKLASRRRGGQKGNTNASRIGRDLRLEMFLSKSRRGYLAEWFELKFGRKPTNNQFREAARQLAYRAIDEAIIEEFERQAPGRVSDGKGECL